jgi:hypothetical protein
MLLLILFVLFYVVLKDSSLKVSADELVSGYDLNINAANKKFLGKEIELTGTAKSFFQFEGEKSLLELRIVKDDLKLYCILMNNEIDEKASALTNGTPVTVFGKCLGIKDYKFPNSIYIEAERIK